MASPPAAQAPRFWLAVASQDHVRKGVAGSFFQCCHGKQAPLQRMRGGDRFLYYAGRRRFASQGVQGAGGGRGDLMSIVATGEVLPQEPYQVKMAKCFEPWRRNVRYDLDISSVKPHDAAEAAVLPLKPLVARLSFVKDPAHWGAPLRSGFLEISAEDHTLITREMRKRLRQAKSNARRLAKVAKPTPSSSSSPTSASARTVVIV